MRRWFTLLLLVLMPLQSVWAAAAAYCQHEEGRTAQHVGHHAHEHHGAASGHGQDGNAGDFDGDCGHCHLGGVPLLPPAAVLPAVVPVADLHAPAASRFRSVDPAPIERPNWASASA